MSTTDLNTRNGTDQQMTLRSTNNSIKSSNNPPTPTPLSSDEFNRVILGMRKTQDATLAQCNALSLSFNKKFGELQSGINSLASQIVDLRSDNTSIRKDLSALNNRIRVVEPEVCKSNISPADNIPQLLQELSERKKCSHNVIVHALIESSATLPAGRLTDDIQHLSDSILPLYMSLPPDVT
ncbi:unnamed protein product [Macrosiphum euphorbiae]|uniref:Uncharacterized protein n=1 Tax=Macrosiphum euphorbiae TaxID=13131 RepID=A0AAV0WIR1_9HEMI|nr:unnamed protein product [Macrosiphum euphorbiae]